MAVAVAVAVAVADADAVPVAVADAVAVPVAVALAFAVLPFFFFPPHISCKYILQGVPMVELEIVFYLKPSRKDQSRIL